MFFIGFNDQDLILTWECVEVKVEGDVCVPKETWGLMIWVEFWRAYIAFKDKIRWGQQTQTS